MNKRQPVSMISIISRGKGILTAPIPKQEGNNHRYRSILPDEKFSCLKIPQIDFFYHLALITKKKGGLGGTFGIK